MIGGIVFLIILGITTYIFCLPIILIRASRRKAMERQIASLPAFQPAIRFDQPDEKLVLLLDPASSQFAVTTTSEQPRLYGFDQLVAVDVERDGLSLQKTNRGSQMLGAAVGGALLGPVGLLLGGLTGSKRQDERVKRLSLKLFTSDLHTPVTEVVFFDSVSGEKSDNAVVKQAARLLDEWHGRFRAILQGNERALTPQPYSQPTSREASQPGSFGRRRGLIAQD